MGQQKNLTWRKTKQKTGLKGADIPRRIDPIRDLSESGKSSVIRLVGVN